MQRLSLAIHGLFFFFTSSLCLLNQTQKDTLINMTICLPTSNFSVYNSSGTLSIFDCDQLTATNLTNNDIYRFGFGNGYYVGKWSPATFPTQIKLFPSIAILDLGDTALSGTIPDLSGMPLLSEIYLSTNQFSGPLPDLQVLPSVTSFVVFNNNFTGTIPNYNATKLQRLELYNNQLSGTIPSFSNTAINQLLLQNNLGLFGNVSVILPLLSTCQIANPLLECPFPSKCESCLCNTSAPSCAAKCLYPGNWSCPAATPTPIRTSPSPSPIRATPTPVPSPVQTSSSATLPQATPTPVPSPVQTSSSATLPQATPTPVPSPSVPATSSQPAGTTIQNGVLIKVSTTYSIQVTVSSFTQLPNTTLTLSGLALTGVAFHVNGTAVLSGTVVIDLTSSDIYDGMQIVLVDAQSLSGVWDNAEIAGSFSECLEVSVDINYTQSQAVAVVSSVQLCAASFMPLSLLALF